MAANIGLDTPVLVLGDEGVVDADSTGVEISVRTLLARSSSPSQASGTKSCPFGYVSLTT